MFLIYVLNDLTKQVEKNLKILKVVMENISVTIEELQKMY